MKEIKLFANVNPLEPSTFIAVASSRTLSMSPETAQKYLRTLGEKLKEQGFKAELQVTLTKTIKL